MAIPQNVEEFSAFFYGYLDRLGFDDIVKTLDLVPSQADGEVLGMSMALKDSIAQASGMYSAAALFGLADITGTLLAMQNYAGSGQFPLAVQSSQNFMSNTKEPQVYSTAKILRGGSSVAVVEVSVHTEDGKELMHSTFTYMLKERKLGK